MVDREKVETVLSRRFPGASRDQVAAAANAIMGLDDEWEEVGADMRHLAPELENGSEFRLLRRRAAA